jgi:hypothetical protein
MERAEGKSSAGAIAIVVIAGVLVLALLGCGGLAAVGWLFTVRSSPMPPVVAPTTMRAAPTSPFVLTITNNAEGIAVIDGKPHTDDELREALRRWSSDTFGAVDGSEVSLQLTPDISTERREAIEKILAESSP